MKKKQFRVLATDGEYFWEIFFIATSLKGDFYLGCPIPGFNGKHSLHKSGKMHFKSSEINQDLGYRQEINNFKGLEQLLCCALPMHLFEKNKSNLKHYTGKNFTETMLVDSRNFKKGIQISIFLLEKEGFEELSKLPKEFKDRLVIFTQTDPWIVISVFDQG